MIKHYNASKTITIKDNSFASYGKNQLIDFISYYIIKYVSLQKVPRKEHWKTGVKNLYKILDSGTYYIALSNSENTVILSFVPYNIKSTIMLYNSTDSQILELAESAINNDYNIIVEKLSNRFNIINNE